MVSSSMFITALAPNTMAIALITKAIGITIPWTLWFKGFLPVGIVLTLIQPALLYLIYPPQIKDAPEAPRWAAGQLKDMGAMTRQEITMLILVLGALGFWIGGAAYVDPAIVAGFVILGMVIFRVVPWDEIVGHSQAWNTLIWFATLVTLAGGLAETKFLDWLAASLVPMLSGLGVYATIAGVVLTFFFLHYFFASITAHTATLFPLFLAVAIKIPVVTPVAWALLLAYPLGLIGVLTPYASGQNAVYYGSGYIKRRDFWVLGFILGVVYMAVYLAIIVKWLGYLGV
jgi:L-tartrate/succinate antiporter